MPIEVLIAHAEGEEELAEKLARPIRAAGYEVAHRGTVMIGESIIEEASKVLMGGGPVVLCGTVRALGTGWAHRLVNAARKTPRVRVFPVQMEEGAYVEQLSLDTAVARYWQDQEQAERDLLNALGKYYPSHLNQQSLTQVQDAEQRYRELALASCDIIDLANLPENDRHVATRQLELRRLYVALRVRVEVASGIEAEAAHIEAIEKKQRSLRGPFSALSGGVINTVEEDPGSRVPIGQRLAIARRLVVLGDAGAGKTTLIRWIATAYLLRLKEDADIKDLPDVGTLPYGDWLPVIIRCRDLDLSCLSGSLEDLLRHTLRKAELRDAEVTLLVTGIVEKLTQGQVMLLLDGLDEITDISLRSKFCQQLQSIQIAYPNAPIIVTSRVVGYREIGARLGRGFEHVTIASLTKDDKDDFAHRWCSLTERPERQTEAAAELIHDIHSSDRIERLTGNPMLLTTMALVKRKVGRLPSRRADLYWDALEVLLNWRREVDLPIDHREAVPQLEYIAYAMCERGIQQIREDEIIALLRRMRDEYNQIHSLLRRTPEDFLSILERRTGILVEAGHVRHLGRPTPIFEFRHLTFQEYLAGLALVDGRFPGRNRSQSLAQNVAPLAGRVIESVPEDSGEAEIGTSENWSEALRLCVATCNDDDVDSVLLAIVNSLEGVEDGAKTKRPRAILAALSLADEPNVSHDVALHVLRSFVNQVNTSDGSGPITTGVDTATRELGNSRWASALLDLLVGKFIEGNDSLSPAVGGLCGAILSSGASHSAKSPEWLSTLVNRLSSEDESTAVGAALAIMDIAWRGEITLLSGMTDSLMKMLEGTNSMSHAASWALRWLNDERTKERWIPKTELTKIIEIIEDTTLPPVTLRMLIGILGRALEKRAVRMLLDKLETNEKGVQTAAIDALGRIGSVEAVIPLIAMLQDQNVDVRSDAVIALGRIKDVNAISALLNSKNDQNEDVRARSLEALNNFQDERVTDSIISALEDPSELVRVVAAVNLGKRRDTRAVGPLVNKLEDRSPSVQRQAARALGQIADPSAEDSLLAKLANDNPSVRAAAITALGLITGLPVSNELVDGLKDGSSEVRSAAEHGLFNRAIFEFDSGNVSEAGQIFKRMSQVVPSEDYKNDLAYCMIILGQYEQAAIELDLIDLSFSFNSPLYRHNRGILFYLMGEADKGYQLVKEALSMADANSDFNPRDIAYMLVLQQDVVTSVSGIPMDAATIINLFKMHRMSLDEVITEMFKRYPKDGEQWIALADASLHQLHPPSALG